MSGMGPFKALVHGKIGLCYTDPIVIWWHRAYCALRVDFGLLIVPCLPTSQRNLQVRSCIPLIAQLLIGHSAQAHPQDLGRDTTSGQPIYCPINIRSGRAYGADVSILIFERSRAGLAEVGRGSRPNAKTLQVSTWMRVS